MVLQTEMTILTFENFLIFLLKFLFLRNFIYAVLPTEMLIVIIAGGQSTYGRFRHLHIFISASPGSVSVDNTKNIKL